MDLQHLQEFVTLAEERSFSRAAERLFVSQSSISKHLRTLEGRLGVTLVLRSTHAFELTDPGRIFLDHARRLVHARDAALSAIAPWRTAPDRALTIAAIPSMTAYGITDVLMEFRGTHPELEVNLIEGETAELREQLVAGECDLAFLRSTGSAPAGLDALPFANDRLVAVVPAGHRLSEHRAIMVADLQDERLLLLKPATVVHDLAVNACLRNGINPHIGFTGSRGENIVEMAERGAGVALLMRKGAERFDQEGLAIIDIEPAVVSQVDLCMRHGERDRPAIRSFLETALPARSA